MGDYEYPITVTGWTSAQSKSIKNKLHIYFQSKKKANGGDCKIQVDDQALGRATVYFKSDEVRHRVLERRGHEICLDGTTISLQVEVCSPDLQLNSSIPQKSDTIPDGAARPDGAANHVAPGAGRHGPGAQLVVQGVPLDMSRDLLLLLLENVSGLEEGQGFTMETLWEANIAVLTFSDPQDGNRFLTVSQNNSKFQRHGLTARQLEEAQSVLVQMVPSTMDREVLELYFETRWKLPTKIVMVPEEQAAVVSFDDPQVVQSVLETQEHFVGKTPVKVYPYHGSLASALLGPLRPHWRLPEPLAESVDHGVRKFLLAKQLLGSLNQALAPHCCSLELDAPQARLRPLPALLRQPGLTEARLAGWMAEARAALRALLAQYAAFQCRLSTAAWALAEKDVRAAVGQEAILVLDGSGEVLTVAGRAEHVEWMRATVEGVAQRAMGMVDRQVNGVCHSVGLPPAMHFILQQEGLQRAAAGISSELQLSYTPDTLLLSGLPAEVSALETWIAGKRAGLRTRRLDLDPPLLDFLRAAEPMEMSQDLLTSRGVPAVYSKENNVLQLRGTSSNVLADAEKILKVELSSETLSVEDKEVLQKPEWKALLPQLLDVYTLSRKRPVDIHVHTKGRCTVTVAGFFSPVKEVSRSLKAFMADYSQVRESVRVRIRAVAQFIQQMKSQDWSSFATAEEVKVHFDPGRPRITLSGARVHVQKVKGLFQEMAAALCTDQLVVDKPGARKFFQGQGSLLLTVLAKELGCVVLLCSQEDDDDVAAATYCQVQAGGGVLLRVRQADICRVTTDAVVNAANEDLKHCGGVAAALLRAAGPRLQELSTAYVAKHGPLRPGNAVATEAGALPCRYVVHAVGPRYTDWDPSTAVLHLKAAVRASLREAARLGCSSLAMPTLSAGVFGFPLPLCTQSIARALREWCEASPPGAALRELQLLDTNEDTVRALAHAVATEFSHMGPSMSLPPPPRSPSSTSRGKGPVGRGRGGGGGGRGRGEGSQAYTGAVIPWGNSRPGGAESPYRRGGNGYRRAEHEGVLGTMATPAGLTLVLRKGCIQEQCTDVIINSISENLNMRAGAISQAILEASGPQLQAAVSAAAPMAILPFGTVVVTGGFDLRCSKVFHAVCPSWDGGDGPAQQSLLSIIRYSLHQADKLGMASLSLPAIGTGAQGFPRALVSRLLLTELQAFIPKTLQEVAIIIHPADTQSVECFTREFKGPPQGHIQYGDGDLDQSASAGPTAQSQESPDSISKVTSPSLGVHIMKIGQLTFEVSSGDITKETCDVIVNSSNANFNLKSGVSKAILDAAGPAVEQECLDTVNAPGYQQRAMIVTSAGQLPSRAIIHVVGRNDPDRIKELVSEVLELSEARKFTSIAFPALGTGQGGVGPSEVASAMLDAVVEHVRKGPGGSLARVKVLLFQTAMLKDFHSSMVGREGNRLQQRSVLAKLKDFTNNVSEAISLFFLGGNDEQRKHIDLAFEPAVFQLCAENSNALRQTKQKIQELILAEQADRKVTGRFISKLTQDDLDQITDLQRKLTVSISLDTQGAEPCLQIVGLTRDVLTAEASIRDMLQRVERCAEEKQKAALVSELVEWQYWDQHKGKLVPFNSLTNYHLEMALENKTSVKVKIHKESYTADVGLKRAKATKGKEVELVRRDLKGLALPPHWEDMSGCLTKMVDVLPGSLEYSSVEQQLTRTGLALNIISMVRVQNKTLWQSYQLMKKSLEEKNKQSNNERLLFHGTDATAIDCINSRGFNRSFAGAHGAMYGNGTYFAVDPVYSAQNYAKPDTKGHRRMYLAQVLVGDFTRGVQNMITPPPKGSGSSADLYDSVVDQVTAPTMFVIFSDTQAYPEYLITFK